MWTTVPPAKSRRGKWPPVALSRSAHAPDHVGHGAVDEERPEGEKDGHGAELHALGKCAGDERRGDDGEHELVDHEGLLGNGGGVVGIGSEGDAAQEEVLEAADEPVAVTEGQRVADDGPEDGDQAHHGEALHHGAEDVLFADQAAVEEGQSGAGHEQDEGGGDQHPGVVAGGLSAGGALLGRRPAAGRRSELASPAPAQPRLEWPGLRLLSGPGRLPGLKAGWAGETGD